MTFNERINAIERIHQLISLKATGAPDELAQRLGVSRSTVYEFIESMKNLGAEIEYCRSKRTFVYTEKMFLMMRYSKRPERVAANL